MKLPIEIGLNLARQWYQSSIRVKRLLVPEVWPLDIPIGKPSAGLFSQNPQAVQLHVDAWRKVKVGTVDWTPVSYRASLSAIQMPTQWNLHNPSEWIAASGDPEVSREYKHLEYLIERIDECFHTLLVAQRTLWLKKATDEVIAAAHLAKRLEPGCAKGRPLRMLAEHGVDTKFFERNANLLAKLLDERFEGEVSKQGLAVFLDALDDSSHWVLLAPLSANLLPFKRLRVTTAELAENGLLCARLLAVENEQCLHFLPELPGTIAVLGSGLDLQWLASPKLSNIPVGYWGDLDTWGLLMLARAKRYRPGLTPLLMNRSLFDAYASRSAVIEPVIAGSAPPEGLDYLEVELYQHLLVQERGRLEQEYLPRDTVQAALINWFWNEC
jgi:hypothetical protein